MILKAPLEQTILGGSEMGYKHGKYDTKACPYKFFKKLSCSTYLLLTIF